MPELTPDQEKELQAYVPAYGCMHQLVRVTLKYYNSLDGNFGYRKRQLTG